MIGQGKTITFKELLNHPKYQFGNNGHATVDGVAITEIGNSDEHFYDAKGKTVDYHRPKKCDNRRSANEKRKGERLERNGKYIRSGQVRRTIMAWVGAIGGIHKVKFVTVTFPCGTPDDLAKKCLNIFTTRWRKAVPQLSYLWTAERQKNGTIHFHFVTDRYTDVSLLNGWMRASLRNKVDQIPNWSKSKCEKYNGVDLAGKKYSKAGIEGYLAKYLTKAQKSGISQPWHRSREMGELATKVRLGINRVHAFMELAILSQDLGKESIRIFENDYCLYIHWPNGLNQHIKWMLNKYNRDRWRGVKSKQQYHIPVQTADDLKAPQSSETNTVIGSQSDMLNLFPATNYQTKERSQRSGLR